MCINGCQMISNEGLITILQRHGKWWDITIWCTVWQLHFHHSMRTGKLLGIWRITWSSHNRLRVLEMFGCFNIKAKGISYLSANCINLKTLNLGQCYKVRFDLSATMLAVYVWVFIQSNCHPFEMWVHVYWSVSIWCSSLILLHMVYWHWWQKELCSFFDLSLCSWQTPWFHSFPRVSVKWRL